MQDGITHQGSKEALLGKEPDEERVDKYSNEMQVDENTPPAFLVHASDDGAVPVQNSLLYYQALQEHEVPAEMHIYTKGGHGFGLGLERGFVSSWTQRCADWLKLMNKE